MESLKRKLEECSCGCTKSSVWDCYNVKIETLKRESKKLKMTKRTKEYVRKLGLEIKRDEDKSWVVEYEDAETLVERLRGELKKKEISAETRTAFEMLEDCEVVEVPIRAAYVLESIFH